VVAVALFFDLLNGFHDGCNAVSTVIYTGALKPKVAIALSAVFNFVALSSWVWPWPRPSGGHQRRSATAHLVIAALLERACGRSSPGCGPSMSSSHALVGGLLGAGVAALGTGGINWHKVILVFASLLASRY